MKVRRLLGGIGVAVTAALAAAIFAGWVTGFTPWIVVSEGAPEARPAEHRTGTLVAPLRELDLDTGEWAAYVLLPPDDYLEVRKDVPRSCLKLTDREALKQLQRGLVGKFTGGDVATVTSGFVLVRDGRIVFESAIVLRGRDLVGLQSSAWGWLTPQDPAFAIGFADRFRPVWPLCII